MVEDKQEPGAETVDLVDLQAEVEDAPLPESLPDNETEPYNPARDRERARSQISAALIGILAGLVLFSFITLWASAAYVRATDLKDLVSVLIGPIGALVGSATGFYFGKADGK